MFFHIGNCLIVTACLAIGTGVQAEDSIEIPEEVDLRAEYIRLDLTPCVQGSRNTCSLFAITALAEFESASATGEAISFSQEYLTWAANSATGSVGDQAMFYEALAGLNALGICSADQLPYERREDRNRQPSDDVIETAGLLSGRWRIHWIKLWDIELPLTDDQLDEIRRALAAGHPVACGLRWPNADPGFKLIEVPDANDVFDGHSIAFVGYRDDPETPGGGVFTFRNSYGHRWGDEGYGEMSYAYARAYANDALWIELGPSDSEIPIERFEAESLEVVGQQACSARSQSMRSYGTDMWSNRRHLFCQSEDGGWVELGFNVSESGTYRVRVLATAAPDYGRVRLSLDGLESTFDLYSGRVCPAGSLELGEFTLESGTHRLRVESVEKSEASNGYSFGVDALDLLTSEQAANN